MKQLLIHLLTTYKYPIIIPIAFLEGHVVSLLSGFLSRTGILNPFIAGICIATGNLLGDIALYWLGYSRGEKLIKRFGKHLGITEQKLAKGHELYHFHKSSILLFSKLTNGFGLATVILTTAGVMKIKFSTYMFWNFIGECIWTGGLISLGYFIGNIYETVNNIILKIGLIAGILLLMFLLFIFIRNRIKTKMNI